MDLDALDVVPGANAGHEFEALDLNGNGTGIFITILGRDSDEFRKRLDAQQQARVQSLFKGGQFRPGAIQSPEQDRAKAIETLAVATKSWRSRNSDGEFVPTVRSRGEDFDCTFANAKLIYERLPALRDQAQEVADNRANFVKGA